MALIIQIDVTKLTKEEVKNLFLEMLTNKMIDVELLDLIRAEISEASKERPEKVNSMIEKHFDKYDDVFKALA